MKKSETFFIVPEDAFESLKKYKIRIVLKYVIFVSLSCCLFLLNDEFWHIIGTCILARNLYHLFLEWKIIREMKTAPFIEGQSKLNITLNELLLDFNKDEVSVLDIKKDGVFVKFSRL